MCGCVGVSVLTPPSPSPGHDHLVVATATQCHVFSLTALHSPHIFDLRGAVSLLLPAERHFALVSAAAGVQIVSYEGRVKSAPRYPGLKVELLNGRTLSVGADLVAILDKTDNKSGCWGGGGGHTHTRVHTHPLAHPAFLLLDRQPCACSTRRRVARSASRSSTRSRWRWWR